MTTSPIEMRKVQVSFGDNTVLHEITATIHPGECVAITGSNGSGKSTLLKALLGIIPLHSGEIKLFGRKLGDSIAWNRIGYVPQRISVVGGVASTVNEVVKTGLLGPKRLWIPKGGSKRVNEALERVNLLHRKADAFDVLSGGQQQRALIARALVRMPDLLLLDEPLTGLDELNRKMLAEVTQKYKDEGKTQVIVLHELGELAPFIDRELRISSGHIIHDGPCTHELHEEQTHHHQGHQAKAGLGRETI